MTEYKIGVISDTHGLVRESALRALQGADLIIHAGDVGGPHVLEQLQEIAEVVAVRGNNDIMGWAKELPKSQYIEFAGLNIYVLHNIDLLDLDPEAADIDVVIFGHTHQPFKKTDQGILYLNPGSAGPRRFNYPLSVAVISIKDGQTDTEFINLDY